MSKGNLTCQNSIFDGIGLIGTTGQITNYYSTLNRNNGIYVYGCNNLTITVSLFLTNILNGIYLTNSSSTINITNNNIVNNSGCGIKVDPGCSYLIFTGNFI